MPMVGTKKFPYTKEGMKKAKEYGMKKKVSESKDKGYTNAAPKKTGRGK
jgi:hypothetical protein